MESLESIEYGKDSAPKCLNELTFDDVLHINEYLKKYNRKSEQHAAFEKLIGEQYSAKTFVIQTDYDYMFGNVSWKGYFLHYADAEASILKDWQAREGTPTHMIDKSYRFDAAVETGALSELWNLIVEKSTIAVEQKEGVNEQRPRKKMSDEQLNRIMSSCFGDKCSATENLCNMVNVYGNATESMKKKSVIKDMILIALLANRSDCLNPEDFSKGYKQFIEQIDDFFNK
jgi:hypothetical protein